MIFGSSYNSLLGLIVLAISKLLKKSKLTLDSLSFLMNDYGIKGIESRRLGLCGSFRV